MGSTFVLLTLLGICVTCVLSDFGLDLIQGTWTAQVRNADVATVNSNGINPICRDRLPPECDAEIPTGLEVYTFNGTTMEQSYTHLIGVNTTEAAAELMPTCAEFGIYPTEFRLAMPRSEIVSYNFQTGHVVYHDARRPDEFDCVIAKYDFNKGDPFVVIEQRVAFKGTGEQVFQFGARGRCDGPPPECEIDVNAETGEASLSFYNLFELKCTAGDCLYQIEILNSLL